MCPEVFEIVKNMDLSNVETRLALHCAPVIMGIKISNLLSVSKEDEMLVERILKGTKIDFCCLSKENNRVTYILFRNPEFELYINNPYVQRNLIQYGYYDRSLETIFKILQNKYKSCIKSGEIFPHELGLFLGYPTEDVEGFIKNKGENYLYAGYWKVYKDVEKKKLLFDAYESAKEGLLLLVAHGYSMRSIIEYVQDNFVY